MKHSHLRHNKTCLNCGARVPDRYCSHCGQENTESIESFGHLLNHFFADVTHYDSQLLSTIEYLVFKPGFLTKEYNAGKRLSYLNPIRMYIFISAVFFLLMFSGEEKEAARPADVNPYKQHLADSLRSLQKKGKLSKEDSTRNAIYAQWATKLDTLKKGKSKNKGEFINAAFDSHGNVVFQFIENNYKSLADYEAEQKKLTDTAKDGFISHYATAKTLRIKAEHGGAAIVTVKQNVAHNIPKLMFVLLPLFAVFVGMLYGLYRNKNYVYSQHAIFTLHFHSFVFLAFTVLYFVFKIPMNMQVGGIITFIATLGIFAYLAIALHNVYHQKFWLSFLKAMVISVCYSITLMLCCMVIMAAAFIMI